MIVILEHSRRSALYEWFSKCKGDFPMARWISNKIFMEIRSGVIVWLGEALLVLGGGLRSMDEFKNVMVTSLAVDTSLVKFS